MEPIPFHEVRGYLRHHAHEAPPLEPAVQTAQLALHGAFRGGLQCEPDVRT